MGLNERDWYHDATASKGYKRLDFSHRPNHDLNQRPRNQTFEALLMMDKPRRRKKKIWLSIALSCLIGSGWIWTVHRPEIKKLISHWAMKYENHQYINDLKKKVK